MKLLLDNIIFSLQRAGGISTYWYEIISRLNNYKSINFNYSENTYYNLLKEKRLKISRRLIKIKRYLPEITNNCIFHSSYYRFGLGRNVINITTVHDFTYEKYRNGLAKKIHGLQKYLALINSKAIICVSENTKKDLLTFYPKMKQKDIYVIYNGVSNDFYKIKEENIIFPFNRNSYVIFIGSRFGYKRFDLACLFCQRFDFNLLIIGGGILNNYEKIQLNQIRYKHMQGINNKELNIYYNGAFCLFYPSEYEGFGIPILEAMRAGCPVIAQNKSSIPELIGDEGLLFKNEVEIANLVNAIRNKRQDISKKGIERTKFFSWDKCFSETLKVYRKYGYI